MCAPCYTWAPVRTVVYAGMCALPTRDCEQLFNIDFHGKLNKTLISCNFMTDVSRENEMRRYITSMPVIKYIDNLYTSRDILLVW